MLVLFMFTAQSVSKITAPMCDCLMKSWAAIPHYVDELFLILFTFGVTKGSTFASTNGLV